MRARDRRIDRLFNEGVSSQYPASHHIPIVKLRIREGVAYSCCANKWGASFAARRSDVPLLPIPQTNRSSTVAFYGFLLVP